MHISYSSSPTKIRLYMQQGVSTCVEWSKIYTYLLRSQSPSMEALQWLQSISKRRQNEVETGGLERFTLKDIRRITNDFSEGGKIGEGGFGKVYRATLSTGTAVAIKRLNRVSSRDELLTFKTEIQMLSRISHRNLVKLIGFCREKKEEILVYEFISNGTLEDKLIQDQVGNRFDWMERLKIGLDSARGLCYLHNGANPSIIHSDIKPANILLDDNLTAKIADFGISKLIPDPNKSYIRATQVIGTEVYLDPDYRKTRKLNKRSDVYSFGIVMLELIGLDLSLEMIERFKRSRQLVMDIPSLEKHSHLPGFDSFVDLASYCIKEYAWERPRMDEVVSTIEGIKNKASGGNSESPSSANTNMGNSNAAAHQFYTAFD